MHYNGCDYLSMLGLKLNHVSKRGHRRILQKWVKGDLLSFISFSTRSIVSWWRHQMKTFSALLALCAGNLPVTGHRKRTLTRSFDVFFDLRLNKRLSKQSWGWWFESSADRRCSNYIWVINIYCLLRRGLYSRFDDDERIRICGKT